jgi:cytochrome c6
MPSLTLRRGGVLTVAAALLTTVTLAACGSDSSSSSTGGASSTASSGGAAPDGKEIFASSCASCHTLKASDSTGAVGPNLDDLKPTQAVVDKQVTNGGGSMPAFKGNLSTAEIAAVSKYVADNAGKG